MEKLPIIKLKSVIDKFPVSGERVPYTYHHDYLRNNVDKFMGMSRAYVAENHKENQTELYMTTLVYLIEQNPDVILYLNDDERGVCKKSLKFMKKLNKRYDNK